MDKSLRKEDHVEEINEKNQPFPHHDHQEKEIDLISLM